MLMTVPGRMKMQIWDSPEFDAHEQVCLFADENIGLKAIVAVH